MPQDKLVESEKKRIELVDNRIALEEELHGVKQRLIRMETEREALDEEVSDSRRERERLNGQMQRLRSSLKEVEGLKDEIEALLQHQTESTIEARTHRREIAKLRLALSHERQSHKLWKARALEVGSSGARTGTVATVARSDRLSESSVTHAPPKLTRSALGDFVDDGGDQAFPEVFAGIDEKEDHSELEAIRRRELSQLHSDLSRSRTRNNDLRLQLEEIRDEIDEDPLGTTVRGERDGLARFVIGGGGGNADEGGIGSSSSSNEAKNDADAATQRYEDAQTELRLREIAEANLAAEIVLENLEHEAQSLRTEF